MPAGEALPSACQQHVGRPARDTSPVVDARAGVPSRSPGSRWRARARAARARTRRTTRASSGGTPPRANPGAAYATGEPITSRGLEGGMAAADEQAHRLERERQNSLINFRHSNSSFLNSQLWPVDNFLRRARERNVESACATVRRRSMRIGSGHSDASKNDHRQDTSAGDAAIRDPFDRTPNVFL